MIVKTSLLLLLLYAVSGKHETLGPWSADGRKLVRKISTSIRLVNTSGDVKAGSFFAQRLSLAVQRGNAASILGSMPQAGDLQVSRKDADPPLEWPRTYSTEATKLYLSAGWVENLKYWQDGYDSRMDNGAITTLYVPVFPDGYIKKFEIYPQTTEDETNVEVCNYKDNGLKIYLLLPKASNFERIGYEDVKGVNCVKFAWNKEANDTVLNVELWAFYNLTVMSWIPVRYETRTSNTLHGYLKSHTVTDYFNFSLSVNNKVFDITKQYECKEKESEEDTSNSYDENNSLLFQHFESLAPKYKIQFEEEFTEYKRKFNKQYAHQSEHNMRKNIFYKKLSLVTETNRKNLSYTLALNKMSDRTEEELKRYMGLRSDKPRSPGNVQFPYSHEEIKNISETLPLEYDLRLEGVVGPVLDQLDCGSCYSFATTAAVEGALAKSNGGLLISLSNQALLDCSWGMDNLGCNGGYDGQSYKWIMKHGLPTVAEYGPYLNHNGYCKIENMTTTYKIRGWTEITWLSEEAIKVALMKHGPLSVAVYAGDAFHHYDGGILYDTECKNHKISNHEVLLVGYGKKDGEPYWILKNSWGPYWGIDGYIHISRRDNNCGVMTEPTYPVL